MKKFLILLLCFPSLLLHAQKSKKVVEFHYKKLKSAEGQMANGKKEGLWHYWTRTGVLSKTITYAQGLPHGDFSYYDTSKIVFSPAQWEQPQVYKAVLDTQQRYATGRPLKKSGSYAAGQKNGTWKEYSRGVLLYETNYANGVLQGESKEYRFSNGLLKQLTTFDNGRPHGPSREYQPNGTIKEEGNYENGLKTGPWTTMETADKYVRHYAQGKLNGSADHYNQQDSLVERYLYKDGAKNGAYFMVKGNGHNKITGEYLDDKEHGWMREYDQGQLEKETYLRNGKPDGAYARYHKGVLVEKGFYKKGQQDSTWTSFHASGGKSCESLYLRGELQSENCFDTQGQKIKSYRIEFKKGQLVRTYTDWYNHQQKRSETVVTDDKKIIRSWNEKGKLLKEEVLHLKEGVEIE